MTLLSLPWINYRGEWGLARHNGASPQELVDQLDLQISQMLAADIPDKPQAGQGILRNRTQVASIRESILGSYARGYADQGDFEAAQQSLSNLGSEAAQEFGLNEVLERAQTPEQIAAVKPDEMTLEFNPELGLQFRVAEALVGNDADELAALSLELARSMSDGNKYLRTDNIRKMQETVASLDAQRGLVLAKDLLALLREQGARSGDMAYLSEALIAAGDSEEPARRLKDINERSLNDGWRLLGLWKLGQSLKGETPTN